MSNSIATAINSLSPAQNRPLTIGLPLNWLQNSFSSSYNIVLIPYLIVLTSNFSPLHLRKQHLYRSSAIVNSCLSHLSPIYITISSFIDIAISLFHLLTIHVYQYLLISTIRHFNHQTAPYPTLQPLMHITISIFIDLLTPPSQNWHNTKPSNHSHNQKKTSFRATKLSKTFNNRKENLSKNTDRYLYLSFSLFRFITLSIFQYIHKQQTNHQSQIQKPIQETNNQIII